MLAIIPARGGSKGLPGKNIRPLCGKPLIAYTIEAAKKSKYISRIVVSTDAADIAASALQYGAEVPFMRPGGLAADDAKALDVYLYTVERLNQEGDSISDFIVLQPTSPLRTASDIDDAISLYKANNADSVISVRESVHPPEWYKVIAEDGSLKDYLQQGSNGLNRQEYTKTYVPNGALFIFNYKRLKESRNYYAGKALPYIMPGEASVDIDTLFDFNLAEFILESKKDIQFG